MKEKILFLFSLPDILLDVGNIFVFDFIPFLRLPQAEPGSTEADEQQDCPCDEVSLRQQIEAAESQEAKENRIPRLDHDIEPLRDSPHMNPSYSTKNSLYIIADFLYSCT